MSRNTRFARPSRAGHTRRPVLSVEAFEKRELMASNGFVQGYDLTAASVPVVGATIDLLQGTNVVATATTNSDGYYGFNNVVPGTYTVTQVAGAYTTSSVGINTTIDAASPVNGGKSIQVTVVDPTAQQYSIDFTGIATLPIYTAYYNLAASANNLASPDNAADTTDGNDVGQLDFVITSSNSVGSQSTFVGVCTDLLHDVSPNETYTVIPALTPSSTTLTANIGQLDYLYNHYGQTTLGAVDAAGIQLAMWELEYDSSPNLATGNFTVLPGTTTSPLTAAAVINSAQNFLNISAGKSEDAYFLNDPAGTQQGGGQGTISTDLLNFTSAPAANNGAISGTVFADQNCNDTQDSNESGIAGATVSISGLTASGTALSVPVTTTNASGQYVFGNLPASGSAGYTVTVTTPSGYIQESPASITKVLAANATSTGNNFAEEVPASISGTVYKDTTGNGFSSDDTPFAGVTVNLYQNNNGTPIAYASTTTSSTGAYSFTNLPMGSYFVAENVPTNYVETGPALGTYYTLAVCSNNLTNENFDNAAYCPGGMSPSNISYTITTPSGQSTTVSTLRGSTAQGDTVTANFTVPTGSTEQLSLASYTAPTATYSPTNANQQVLFQSVTGTYTAGTYHISVLLPDCYYQVDFACGAVINQFGPNGSNINYNYQNRLIDADNEGTQVCSTSSLSGVVYYDANNNGSFGSGDTGVSGVTVAISGTSYVGIGGTPFSESTTTGTGGAYTLSNVPAGTYTVTETTPSGYIIGTSTVGSVGGTAGSGSISSIVENTNTTATGYNFGLLLPSSISGTVYKDTTGNGLSADDTAFPGVTVNLYLDNNGAPVFLTSTTTSSTGAYSFPNLGTATYFVAQNTPSGYVQTAPGNPGYYTETTAPNSGITNVNFDNAACLMPTLSSASYTDTTPSGTSTTTSSLVTHSGDTETVTFTVPAGVTETLSLVSYTAPSSSFNDATAYQQVVFQSATGTYGPGTYSLTVAVPNSYYQVDFVGGYVITTLGNSGNNQDYNYECRLISANNGGSALATNSNLSGTVYIDNNNNGSFGSGDTGYAGETVTITGTTVVGNSAFTESTTTGSNGAYTLANVPAGTYTVSETPPSGYTNGTATPGTSGGRATSGAISTIFVNTNTAATGYNFGLIAPASGAISGTVYKDTTGDGLTADDTPFAGVLVDLVKETDGNNVPDSGDTYIENTTTNSSGGYSFGNLSPGLYYVVEVTPSGYVITAPLSGNNTVPATVTNGGNAVVNYDNAVVCGSAPLSNVYYTVSGPGCNGTITVSTLRGNVQPGDTATAYFTVTGSSPIVLSLVAYDAPSNPLTPTNNNAFLNYSQQFITGVQTGTFAPGAHSMTVTVPNGYGQIDFVCGKPDDGIGVGANTDYGPQNRCISSNGEGTAASQGEPVAFSDDNNDIGAVTQPGSYTFNNGTYTLTGGAGGDIWWGADQIQYVYQTLNGNGQIIAHVDSVSNVSTYAKGGIMIRSSLDTASANASLVATPSSGLQFNYRATSGGQTTSALSTTNTPSGPVWIKLVRSGSTITAFDSTDGQNWTQIGSTSITMGSQVFVGLVASSAGASSNVTAVFDSVTTSVPIDYNIGNDGVLGTTTTSSNGTITVTGSGGDIWNTADQFNFDGSQELGNNDTIIVHADSISGSNAWAKAGIMIRSSLAPGAAQADLVITPANGLVFQDRESANASSVVSDTASNYSSGSAEWLKLVRNGNTISGYDSSDGVNWTLVGTDTSIQMGASAYVGLAVTAHDNTTLATGTFDSLSSSSSYSAFWGSSSGTNLLCSFGNSGNSTCVGSWLANTYPNLFGWNSNTNFQWSTNSQIASYCQNLVNTSGTGCIAYQAISAALSCYATSQNLGGSWASPWGFSVSSSGCSSASVWLGNGQGQVCGVSDNTTVSLGSILSSLNSQSSWGNWYGGNSSKQSAACSVFGTLNCLGNSY